MYLTRGSTISKKLEATTESLFLSLIASQENIFWASYFE